MAMPREPISSARPSASTQASVPLARMKAPYHATCEAAGVSRPEANAKHAAVPTANAATSIGAISASAAGMRASDSSIRATPGRDEVAEDTGATIGAARGRPDQRARDDGRETQHVHRVGVVVATPGRAVADGIRACITTLMPETAASSRPSG